MAAIDTSPANVARVLREIEMELAHYQSVAPASNVRGQSEAYRLRGESRALADALDARPPADVEAAIEWIGEELARLDKAKVDGLADEWASRDMTWQRENERARMALLTALRALYRPASPTSDWAELIAERMYNREGFLSTLGAGEWSDAIEEIRRKVERLFERSLVYPAPTGDPNHA